MKIVILLAVLLSGCAEPVVEPGLKAIVGGRLEASLEAAPVEYSVIVIAGGKVRALGAQAAVPVPKGAETIGAKGMVVRPMPYDGALVVGGAADLVVVDGESGRPERVMSGGEWVK